MVSLVCYFSVVLSCVYVASAYTFKNGVNLGENSRMGALKQQRMIKLHVLGGEQGSSSEMECSGSKYLDMDTTSFISKIGELKAADLDDLNLLKIVEESATDIDVNVLLWKCLGYSLSLDEDEDGPGVPNGWSNVDVFPKWKSKFPSPPDLIGVTRKYDPETDKEVRNASMDLMRSIPRSFKGGVRSLQEVGFKGYKLKELTPNKTRRAQAVNWLIYYRDVLFGKTIEELKAQRSAEQPVSEDIAKLPSEKWFEKNRVD